MGGTHQDQAMAGGRVQGVPAFTSLTRRYIRWHPQPLQSAFESVRFVLSAPFTSRRGLSRLARAADAAVPRRWREDLTGRKVLIVGSGPSLDRAPAELFARFDTVMYINFALRTRQGRAREYFFTTDLGPAREYLDKYGDADFVALGQDRCILAPYFFDQVCQLTGEGRGLFTLVACDRTEWKLHAITVGPLRLPVLLRCQPQKPDWTTYDLPVVEQRIPQVPVVQPTSALSALVLAGALGAAEIGLIGCDFSTGRAAAAGDTQAVPTARTFSAAIDQFHAIAAVLVRRGIAVTNHSWLV